MAPTYCSSLLHLMAPPALLNLTLWPSGLFRVQMTGTQLKQGIQGLEVGSPTWSSVGSPSFKWRDSAAQIMSSGPRSLFLSQSFPLSIAHLWFLFLIWFNSQAGCLHVGPGWPWNSRLLTSSVSLFSGRDPRSWYPVSPWIQEVLSACLTAWSQTSSHFGWSLATLNSHTPNPVFWEGGSCDREAVC